MALRKIGLCKYWGFVLHLLGGDARFWVLYLLCNQPKKAAGSSGHIVCSVVGIPKSFAKKFLVQLGKGRPFELASFSARERTELGGNVLGIEFCHAFKGHDECAAKVF